MSQRKLIFSDAEIVEFCKATQDTNELHDPAFMGNIGKRIIVPGMFALSRTICLDEGFLKSRANVIKVLFNSLLSSGDFVTLSASPDPENPCELLLSAINHKDTLSSHFEHSFLFLTDRGFENFINGIHHRVEMDVQQVQKFKSLVGAKDPDVANFLFAVSFTSKALLNVIDHPETEIEKEIDELINKNSKVSPFYQSLEIHIPVPFPVFTPAESIDYFIHYQREIAYRLYTAHIRCETDGKILFHSQYKMGGIPDRVILRMAKDFAAGKKNLPDI
jgi:hypothetical protein